MIDRRMAILGLALSATGFVSIVSNEGYTDQAVIPIPGDVPTIGFGTTDNVHIGDKTNPVEALNRAIQDVSKFEGALRQCVRVPLSQGEYDAYISFSYNVGSNAFCSSTLVKLLNKGEYQNACEQLKRWTCGSDPTGKYSKMFPNHTCGKGKAPIPGLVNRREEEYKRCITAAKNADRYELATTNSR